MKIILILLLLATAIFSETCDEYNPCHIYAEDGTYLGNTGNKYDKNSINNPYGDYGSKYSSKSINNPYGDYGSQYSNQSPNNPYNHSNLPKVYDSEGNYVGKMKLREKSEFYKYE